MCDIDITGKSKMAAGNWKTEILVTLPKNEISTVRHESTARSMVLNVGNKMVQSTLMPNIDISKKFKMAS